MKRFSEQFKKQSESIKMRASERTALKSRLLTYMEYHPMPKEVVQKMPAKTQKGVLVSDPFKTIVFNKIYFRSFSGAFALFLILSVPVFAEKAVPGDVLYPVKVQFNEEVRSTLSFTPYAKVAWETQRLERRISEARLLASEGKLTVEAEAKVAEAVKTHSDAAQREIAELRESDSDEAAIAEIAFASALAVQSEVLEGHIEKGGQTEVSEGTSVVALAQVVAQARTSAEAAQTEGVQLSFEKLLGRVEIESTRISELFESVKNSASSEEVANVERRLADIERKVSQAVALKEGTVADIKPQVATMALSMAKKQAGIPVEEVVEEVVLATSSASTSDVVLDEVEVVSDEVVPAVLTTATTSPETEAEAITLLRSALTDIQKLLNYLTHIDVRENVSIEDLVPVIPTIEERSFEIMRMYDEVRLMQTEVTSRDVSSKLQSKITHGQKEIDIKLSQLTSAMEKGDLERAETLINDARVLASDLVKLTSNEPFKPVDEKLQVPVATTSDQVIAE